MELRQPTVVKTAEQAIEHAIDTYEVTEKLDPDRLRFLRISSFPFCGTKWLLSYPSASSGKRSNKFMGTFFTSVGTAVHSGIQAVLDHSPFLLQDWKCFSCGRLHKFCLKPKVCKKCGSEVVVGREHEYKKGFVVGHLDGAILLKSGKITIIDYKTTSMRKLEAKGLLPNLENVRQIEAYAALLKEQGYDIEGWTLIYIARNNAKRVYRSSTQFYGHTFEEEYPKILKRIEGYKRAFLAVSQAKTVADVEVVVSKRRSLSDNPKLKELCHYCPYKTICTEDSKLLPRVERSVKLIAARST
jgi:hypothetical protein